MSAVFGTAEAKVLSTSEVRRWPGIGREGGASSEEAVSDGGGTGIVSGVSQNM